MCGIRDIEVTQGVVVDKSCGLAITDVGMLKNTARVGSGAFANASLSRAIVQSVSKVTRMRKIGRSLPARRSVVSVIPKRGKAYSLQKPLEYSQVSHRLRVLRRIGGAENLHNGRTTITHEGFQLRVVEVEEKECVRKVCSFQARAIDVYGE